MFFSLFSLSVNASEIGLLASVFGEPVTSHDIDVLAEKNNELNYEEVLAKAIDEMLLKKEKDDLSIEIKKEDIESYREIIRNNYGQEMDLEKAEGLLTRQKILEQKVLKRFSVSDKALLERIKEEDFLIMGIIKLDKNLIPSGVSDTASACEYIGQNRGNKLPLRRSDVSSNILDTIDNEEFGIVNENNEFFLISKCEDYQPSKKELEEIKNKMLNEIIELESKKYIEDLRKNNVVLK
ncbi:MAG: hypothetical protein K0U66_03820 [Gammaproteobacteria bacterium]|nr:hypothetical protein [Gammaproteobacteria bacterium]